MQRKYCTHSTKIFNECFIDFQFITVWCHMYILDPDLHKNFNCIWIITNFRCPLFTIKRMIKILYEIIASQYAGNQKWRDFTCASIELKIANKHKHHIWMWTLNTVNTIWIWCAFNNYSKSIMTSNQSTKPLFGYHANQS